MTTLLVASTIIGLDLPDMFISENMSLFRYDSGGDIKADVYIGFSHVHTPDMPIDAVPETNAPVHTVYSLGNDRLCIRTESDFFTYFQYNDDCSHFMINLNERIDVNSLSNAEKEDMLNDAANVLSRIFIMIIAARGGVSLHSASLLHKGEAVLFSASSGTGKTTHAGLWAEVFSDVEMINGDNGYCFFEDGGAYIYGAPWCGTSGQCANVKAPIRAVVFLEHAKQNYIQKLDVAEAFMRLSARCFMPAWDKRLMVKAIDTAEKIAGSVDCYLLKCLPDQDAARVAENEIFKS